MTGGVISIPGSGEGHRSPETGCKHLKNLKEVVVWEVAEDRVVKVVRAILGIKFQDPFED